jgi:hypothetical protein
MARNRKSCTGVAAIKGRYVASASHQGGDGRLPIACPDMVAGASQLGPGLALGLFSDPASRHPAARIPTPHLLVIGSIKGSPVASHPLSAIAPYDVRVPGW